MTNRVNVTCHYRYYTFLIYSLNSMQRQHYRFSFAFVFGAVYCECVCMKCIFDSFDLSRYDIEYVNKYISRCISQERDISAGSVLVYLKEEKKKK